MSKDRPQMSNCQVCEASGRIEAATVAIVVGDFTQDQEERLCYPCFRQRYCETEEGQ